MKDSYARLLMQKRSVVGLLLISLIAGAFLTSWAEPTELNILMPIRNLIVVGRLQAFSQSQIGATKYKDGQEGINPVQVAQIVRGSALSVLEDDTFRRTLPAADVTKIVEVADFLGAYGELRSAGDLRYKLWPYKFDYPYYGLKSPWYSAMAQGHAIEVMLAAFKLTGDARYLDEARLAANALFVPVAEGGVSNRLAGGLWFEEYASATAKPAYVLNGHNYTLNALWLLSKVDRHYQALFEQGVAAERTVLSQYDVTIWTRYDLVGTIADGHYQRVHIAQLGDLYSRTGDAYFLELQQRLKWQLILPGGVLYRLVRVHNTFLLLVFMLNTFICLAVILILAWLWHRRKARMVVFPQELSEKLGG